MNKPDVVMMGLGYIGLPTAALIAQKKEKVYGVDVNSKVVNTVNRGKVHIVEPELATAVASAVKNGYLEAALKPVAADVYLIVVPTPFNKQKEPDISFVEAATKEIIPLLKAGDLFIIESTSPIGTTEKMTQLIYNERPELKENIYIAYCPERVLPGNVMYELAENDRVIGGINRESNERALKFYQKFVKGKLHQTTARTAEMCKLTENSSRDVQIGFANEISLICDKANINVWELIDLANKHPRVNILQPGCGVGGHCIAVDPYFIIADYPRESKIIASARKVNHYKTLWCVEKIQKEKLKFKLKNGKNPKIALMGLAFKPNIDDLRESPAKYIVEQLLQNDSSSDYLIVEPNLPEHGIFELRDYREAVYESDIIVFLVAHDEFKKTKISENKTVINFCGIRSNGKF